MKKIHITSGDLDGIGLEISLKALYEIGPIKGTQFILWRSKKSYLEKYLHQLDKKFQKISCKEKNINSALKSNAQLIDLICPAKPTEWVKNAAKRCVQFSETLVTGPLSKIQMQKEGFKEKGHTALLQKISDCPHVFMAFLGAFFNVVLLTDHVPLKKISWNKKKLHSCLKLCLRLKERMPLSHRKKHIGILGLNPHAGEEGLLGLEEFLLKKQLLPFKEIKGPLVPDTAFLKSQQKKISIYVGLYHDQGLIPFKIKHERSSFQLSLGLPFIRTSVSHGTAKDIFNQNKANPLSMKKAILGALHFSKKGPI